MRARRQSRIGRLLCGLVAMAGLALAPGARGSQSPGASTQVVFRSQVDVVRVDVLVERDGVPVAGLTASEFDVRDEGVKQQLVGASMEQVPLDAVLVLDTSGSITEANARSLRSAALSFLSGLTAIDRAGLLTFTARVAERQPLTSKLDLVRSAIGALTFTGSTALHDAIYSALRLRASGTTRSAVVVFTDGIDNISWLSGKDVIEAAKRSGAVVHSVVTDMPGANIQASANPVLHALALETGGRVWEARWGPQLAAAFQAVLDDLRARYVLTYYPTGVSDGGWHRLDVKLKGSGKVTARAGYYRSPASRQ